MLTEFLQNSCLIVCASCILVGCFPYTVVPMEPEVNRISMHLRLCDVHYSLRSQIENDWTRATMLSTWPCRRQ
ncbi:hypothetical protein EDC04DRAFT_2693498, partial [Pisolithus marmoratus]